MEGPNKGKNKCGVCGDKYGPNQQYIQRGEAAFTSATDKNFVRFRILNFSEIQYFLFETPPSNKRRIWGKVIKPFLLINATSSNAQMRR